MAKYDEFGREMPDPTPVEMPLGFKHPPTIQEMIQQAIRVEMSRQAESQGLESFEESDDFQVEGELEDSLTQFELHEMQEEYIKPPQKGGSDGKPSEVVGGKAVAGVEGVGRARGEAEGAGSAGSKPVADDSAGKVAADGKG